MWFSSNGSCSPPAADWKGFDSEGNSKARGPGLHSAETTLSTYKPRCIRGGGGRGRSRIYGFAGESTSAMNRPARIVFGKSGRPVSSSRGSGIAGADPHFVRCDRRRYFWQLKPTTFGRLRSDYMSSCPGTFFSGAAGSGLMLSGCRGEICARQANKTGLASGGEEEEEKMMSLKGCQRLRFSRGRSSALTGDAKRAVSIYHLVNRY